jgi:hypothetical protein
MSIIKLDHVDDISFRELFGKIRVGFFFPSTLAILFYETVFEQLL